VGRRVAVALVLVALAAGAEAFGSVSRGSPTSLKIAANYISQTGNVPPAPSVVAVRTGKRVRIAYSFRVWPRAEAQRIVLLLTAVQSSDPQLPPYMKRHRISTRKGVVWQPLGLGKAPFKLLAAAYSREGRSSRTVTVRVRSG